MSQTECGSVREVLPDFASHRLATEGRDVIERHLRSCGECSAELELIRALMGAPPAIPEGLADDVLSALHVRRAPRRPWWGLTAAAVAAIALGIGVSADRSATVAGAIPGWATETGEGQVWLSDDGLLAGAPSIDGLSDEALMQLLDDLSVEGAV